MSKLQDIAREHNWVRSFMFKLLPTHCKYINLSPHTLNCIKQANMYIHKARQGITADWKRTRGEIKKEIKEDLARPKIPF